jgi:plastocyanin
VLRATFLRSLPLFALAFACRESSSPPPSVPAAPQAQAPAPARPAADEKWGVIEGRVRLTGTPPPPTSSPTSGTVVSVCGEQTEDRSLVVGSEGALAYTVVSLKSASALPAPAQPPAEPVLDQKKCIYEPPVLAARAGGQLTLRNSDPLVHNVRASSSTKRSFFNVAMPLEGMSTRKPLPEEPGVVPIRCDIHPWMRAVVRTFDHPYFATTSPDGRFRLEVPEGAHTLVFWHERLPQAEKTVNVRAGERVQVEQDWAVTDLQQ